MAESNLWAKRADESKPAHEALMDYLRMGTKRSLRGLLKRYEKQTSNKPPTTKFNTLSTWSKKFEWVKRAEAYDKAQQAKQDQLIAAARSKLVHDELADYRKELARFRKVRDQLHSGEPEVIDYQEVVDPNTGTVTITKTVQVADGLGAHRLVTKWRSEISALGRRAMGLPEKITEQHVDEIDAEQTVKGYIGISPDDWDDDDETDSAL